MMTSSRGPRLLWTDLCGAENQVRKVCRALPEGKYGVPRIRENSLCLFRQKMYVDFMDSQGIEPCPRVFRDRRGTERSP